MILEKKTSASDVCSLTVTFSLHDNGRSREQADAEPRKSLLLGVGCCWLLPEALEMVDDVASGSRERSVTHNS